MCHLDYPTHHGNKKTKKTCIHNIQHQIFSNFSGQFSACVVFEIDSVVGNIIPKYSKLEI